MISIKKGKLRMKKLKEKMLMVIMFAVALLGVMTGCGSDSTGNDKKAAQLNIAIQPVVGYLPLYVMKDTGSLEKALADNGYDIKVNFVEFESGPPENEAFASKEVDVGVMGNVPAISGIANGQARSIIGIAYNGEKTEAVIVKNDSDINSVGQLKKKKIGLVVGSIAQNYLSVLLESENLKLSDVEIVNLSPGEQQQALESGIVDAVATWEPNISKLTASGDNRILADGTGIFLGENPIIARNEYLENNPEIIRIFLDEYKRTAQLVSDDIQTYATQYADLFLIEPETVTQALSHGNMPVDIIQKDIDDLQNTSEFLYSEGLISEEVKIDEYVKTDIR